MKNEQLNKKQPLREATVSSGFTKRYFSDAEDLHDYMVQNKPEEIWLDEFMEDEPYIIIRSYRDGKFSGIYNHQAMLGGTQDDFRWLFKPNLYVRNRC